MDNVIWFVAGVTYGAAIVLIWGVLAAASDAEKRMKALREAGKDGG